jgi:hypothetical protein
VAALVVAAAMKQAETYCKSQALAAHQGLLLA